MQTSGAKDLLQQSNSFVDQVYMVNWLTDLHLWVGTKARRQRHTQPDGLIAWNVSTRCVGHDHNSRVGETGDRLDHDIAKFMEKH